MSTEEERRANAAPAPVSSSAPGAAERAGLGNRSTGAGHFFRVWLLTLLAGLAAGLLSAFGGEKTFDAFAPEPHFPANYAGSSGYERATLRAQVNQNAKQVVDRKRAMAAFGLLGLLLGVSMGASGGLAGGSIRSGLLAGLVGGVSAAVVGVGLSAALVPVYFRWMDPTNALVLLFLTYSTIFAAVGAAAGMALGWGSRDWQMTSRCLLGGLLGSLVGTFAFQTINSLAFPLLGSFDPVPAERIPRLVLHLCVAIGTAALAGLAAGKAGNRPASGP
jgi:hypothetical protein